MIAVPFSGT